ncbi:sulfite exporter TauE/SafE family protein [Cognatishimia sp.]|uniref:sulfite exporter TauE/SafE family protein n=1 Tax=Cognatishimia sp. TaxID=2211648 RepID=UPI003517FDB0
MDPSLIAIVVLGAFVGGFISGFAGFGFALVVSGIWFAALPVHLVPPLVVLSATAGQLTGLAKLAKHVSWPKAWPLIWAGILGIPLGTALVAFGAPDKVKLVVGVFLIAYTLWQFMARRSVPQIRVTGLIWDRIIGFLGGILGGLAGLSGALPVVWYQMLGMSPAEQRARYQPFNLAILALSSVSMLLFGQITPEVLRLSLIAMPIVILGALTGVWMFDRVTAKGFKRAVLSLLLLSGVMILTQSLT